MKHNWRIQADEREGQNGDTITWFAEDRDESGWAVSHMSLAYTLTNSGPSKAPAQSSVLVFFPPSDSPKHYGLLGGKENVTLATQSGARVPCSLGDEERVQRPPPPVSDPDKKVFSESKQIELWPFSHQIK